MQVMKPLLKPIEMIVKLERSTALDRLDHEQKEKEYRPFEVVIEFRTNRSHLYRIVQTEVSTTSKYQEILIADVQGFGRALFLDGVPQSSSLDEHMSMVYP